MYTSSLRETDGQEVFFARVWGLHGVKNRPTDEPRVGGGRSERPREITSAFDLWYAENVTVIAPPTSSSSSGGKMGLLSPNPYLSNANKIPLARDISSIIDRAFGFLYYSTPHSVQPYPKREKKSVSREPARPPLPGGYLFTQQGWVRWYLFGATAAENFNCP